jgi:hypothetical protein
MKKLRLIHGIPIIAFAACAIALAGYFIHKSIEIPTVKTWSVGDSSAQSLSPSERTIDRQSRALVERDPLQEASMVWWHEDPWLYGIGSGNDMIVPGIGDDLQEIVRKILPVRIVSWAKVAENGHGTKPDRAAMAYAEKYNERTMLILATN